MGRGGEGRRGEGELADQLVTAYRSRLLVLSDADVSKHGERGGGAGF